jgi:hypothetical protein
MSDEIGPIATVTHDGFSISSNEGSAKDIKANLDSDAAPLDGTPEEAEEVKAKAEKEKRSKAASELGKAGGKAAAEARAAKDDLVDEAEPEKGEDEVEDTRNGNPRHDAKARIQQLARERAAERAKNVALEARLAALEAERAAPRVEPTTERPNGSTAPTGDGEPSPEGFETYEEYVKAVARHAARQERETVLREAEEHQRTQTYAQEVVKRVETFNERIRAEPELLERVDSRLLHLQPTFTLAPGTQAGPGNCLADEIVESEMAPKLMLYFSENEAEVVRILKLPNPREIFRAVVKLEDKLAGAAPEPVAEPARPQISQARPPIRAVSTSAQITEEDLSDDMDFDKHYRIMQAKERRR